MPHAALTADQGAHPARRRRHQPGRCGRQDRRRERRPRPVQGPERWHPSASVLRCAASSSSPERPETAFGVIVVELLACTPSTILTTRGWKWQGPLASASFAPSPTNIPRPTGPKCLSPPRCANSASYLASQNPKLACLQLGCSIVAGGLGAIIGTPADAALIRMQSDTTLPEAQRRNYKNGLDAMTRMLREEGLSGASPPYCAPTT